MDAKKVDFLKTELIPLLGTLRGDLPGQWGLMNAQQMVEHLVDVVMIARGKLVFPAVVTGEALEKSRVFLKSEQPFRENIKNPLLGSVPREPRAKTMDQAIAKLKEELDYFFLSFDSNPALTTENPFFGTLDYEMNVQLLYKHSRHHLRQFGLVE